METTHPPKNTSEPLPCAASEPSHEPLNQGLGGGPETESSLWSSFAARILRQQEEQEAVTREIRLQVGDNSQEEVSGAEAVVQSLLAVGVDTVFGYPGGAIMPVYDALYGVRDKLRHVLVRHEQGATHAAEGYARMTGKPGVCIATSGPGATNLITGIADAMLDSVPLVCITGQVSSALLGTEAFQEIDIIGMTVPVTKWNYQVTRAEEIPEVFEKAFRIATEGRPGPVLIDITKDAQVAKFSWRRKLGNTAKRRAKTPKRFELARAAELINGAKKPLILAGHGVIIAGAERELIELAERAEIPVACTLHGLASFAKTHPLYAGFLGMHGNYAPNLLTNQADVILAVGMRFDDRVTGKLSEYAKQAKIIHFEIDPTQVNRLVPVEVALIADVKDAITSLLPLIEKTERPEWRGEFQALHAREHEKVIAQAIRPEGGELKMSEAIYALSELTKGEAVVVADVGQHQMMAARYYEFARPRSMISSGGLGTMGFALPAAMGAKIASPDREVVAIIGDGGFQMTFQELGTVAQEQLAVKMVILNNSYLGMVRQWQELFFDRRYSFVEINSPNLVQLAGAFSIPAERVDAREELHSALQRMLDAKGPYLLEIVVEQEQNVFPMVPAGAGLNDTRLE